MSQIHNVVQTAIWMLHGKEGTQPTGLLPDTAFLPRPVKPKLAADAIRKDLQKQTSFLNRLAGF